MGACLKALEPKVALKDEFRSKFKFADMQFFIDYEFSHLKNLISGYFERKINQEKLTVSC